MSEAEVDAEEIVETDDELVDLLSSISDAASSDEPEPEPEPGPEPGPEPEQTEQQEPELQERSIEILKTVQPDIVDNPEGDTGLALRELAKKFGDTVNTVFSNSIEDRAAIQEVIDYCKGRINDEGRTPEIVIESWVKSTEARAIINIGTTKLLDSIAKLLAASKNHQALLGVDDVGGEDPDLEALLNEPERFDEKV